MTWALGPVLRTRDSNLLDASNADAIEKILNENRQFDGDWQITRVSHWAVGWCEHLSFKVIKDGTIDELTEVFWKIHSIFEALDCYPVLNDDDFSRREYEQTLKNIEDIGCRWLSDKAGASWAADVYAYLSDNCPHEVDSRDFNGAYPTDKSVKDAMQALEIFEE